MNTENKTFLVRVERRFEAAHNLREYHGVEEPLHGHSWKAEVFVRAPMLDHEGMAIDYIPVKKALDEIIAPWDHRYINNIPPFDKTNPTTEHICTYIFDKMAEVIDNKNAWVEKVILWEGPEYYTICEKTK